MKLRNHAAILVFSLCAGLAFGPPALAQITPGEPGKPEPGGTVRPGDTGGTYRGPGDTVGGRPTPGTPAGAVPRPGAHGQPLPTRTRPGVVQPRIPPPGTPGSPWDTIEETPTGRPVIEDETSWQHWWHFNRWSYLDVEHGVLDTTRTGSGGFFLGRGQQLEESTEELRVSDAVLRETVQPALVQAIESGDSAELASQSLLALAKLRGVEMPPGKKRFWQVAPRFLGHSNQTVVERTVLALGVRGDARFLRWLESILADEPDGQARMGGGSVSDRERAFAAYALGLLGERARDPVVRARVHAGLSRALHGDVEEVQGAAIVAMGHVALPWRTVDPTGIPSLFLAARNRTEQIGEVLSFVLDEDQPERPRALAPPALARLLEGAPPETRALVAEALLGLVTAQAKTSRELQNGCVLALGGIGTSSGLPIDRQIHAELERIATRSGHHRLTRYMATVALAQVASRPGAGETPYAGLEPARKLFVRQVTRNRGQSLCWTALALGLLERDAALRGEMPSPEVCGALRRMLERNRTPEVVGAAAVALGLIRDIESAPALYERMLDTGETHVRGYTALALGMIGARNAVDGVHQVLGRAGHQPFALQQAAIGLGLLGDQRTGALLFALLGSASDPEVQASIASALGWLRDPRPIGPLTLRLADPLNGTAPRAWTAVALGRICDRDAWPWVGRWSVGANYDAGLQSLIDEDFQSGLLDLP